MEAQNTGEAMSAVAEETKDALKTASFDLGKTEIAGASIGLKPKKRKKKKGQNRNKDATVEAQSIVESKLAVAMETKDTQNTASFVLEKDKVPVGVSTDMNSKKRKRKGRSSNTDVTVDAQNTLKLISAVPEEIKAPINVASSALEKDERNGVLKKRKRGRSKKKAVTVEVQKSAESTLAVHEETKEAPKIASSVLEKDEMARVPTESNSKKRKKKGRSKKKVVAEEALKTVESMLAAPEETKERLEIVSSVLDKDEMAGLPTDLTSKKSKRKKRPKKKAVTLEAQDTMESTRAVPEETKDPPKIASSSLEKAEMAGVPINLNSKKRKRKGQSGQKVVTVEAQNTMESTLVVPEETKDIPKIATSVLGKDQMAGGLIDLSSKKRKKKKRSKKKVVNVEALNTAESMLAVPEETKDTPKIVSSVLDKDETAELPIDLKSKKSRRKARKKGVAVEALNTVDSTVAVPEETIDTPKAASSLLEKDEMGRVPITLNSKKRKRKELSTKKAMTIEAQNTLESTLAVPEETKDMPNIAVLEKDEMAGVPIDTNSKKRKKKGQSEKKVMTVEALNTAESTLAVPEETKDMPNIAMLEKDEMAGVPIDTNSKKRKKKGQSEKKVMTVEALNTAESTLAVPEETKNMSNIASSVLEKDETAGVPIDTNSKKRKKKGQSEKKFVTVEAPNTIESTSAVPEGVKETPKIVPSVLDKDEMVGPPVDLNSKKSRRKGRSREKAVAVEAQDTVVSTLAVPEDTKDTLITSTVLEKDETAAIDLNSKKRKRGQSVKTDVTVEAQKTVDSVSTVTEETKETLETTSFGLEKSEAGEVTADLNAEKTKRMKSTQEVGTDTSSQKSPIGYIGGTLNHQSLPSVSLIRDDKSTIKPKTDVSSPKANEHTVEDAMNIQNTGESLSAVTEGSLLPGNVGNSSFQVSRPPIVKPRRKLLVLDVNGLLVDVVANYPARFKPDFRLANKGVFKRPFCEDFLRFCFKKFDVGIWSSRTKENLDKAINFLMRSTKHRLLFCWHQSHCTNTGYKTLENREKPLVLKELKKLWENKNNVLPWQKGYFSESNTVLLDDSPYKALLNPPYTAVHTVPYSYQHVGDKALGPDGEIRLYLERLAEAEDVQQFIQANPFGQRPITKEHCSWKFYSKIAGTYANLQDTRIDLTASSPRPLVLH